MSAKNYTFGMVCGLSAMMAFTNMVTSRAEAADYRAPPEQQKVASFLCADSPGAITIRHLALGVPIPKGCQRTSEYHIEKSLVEKHPNYKGWTPIDTSRASLYWVYIDLGSVEKLGDTVRYWALKEYTGNIPTGEFLLAKSIKYHVVMHCDAHTVRTEAIIGYSKKGAMGDITFTDSGGEAQNESRADEIIEMKVCWMPSHGVH